MQDFVERAGRWDKAGSSSWDPLPGHRGAEELKTPCLV